MVTVRSLCFLASAFAFATAAPAQTTPEITCKLGTKFYSLPDEKGVVGAARKNLAADPKNPELLLKLAQAQISVWQDKDAVETLTRALAISPENADLYIERGHRELPLREFAKARADLSRAAALNPKSMAAYYHLGLAHYFLGEFTPAADAFRRAVETAPNTDERINSTNWLYAALRRAKRTDEAAKALEGVPLEMTNKEPHTRFYLNLVRFFQGRMSESEALPPEPPAGNTDPEVELAFDTVAYGIGNWHLYNGDNAKAQEYFRRILKGHVWVTWGFVGAETELQRLPPTQGDRPRGTACRSAAQVGTVVCRSGAPVATVLVRQPMPRILTALLRELTLLSFGCNRILIASAPFFQPRQHLRQPDPKFPPIRADS